jgi:hypothetical protein
MAKAWNLSATKSTVAGREISVILLGESGRGRQLTSIPTEQGIENGGAVSVTLAETKANGLKTKPSIKVGTSAGNTWAARISTEGSYIRGAQGNVSFDPSQAPKTPTLVARGHGAFGDAGRTGSWDDVIVLVEDGTVLRVKPSRGDAYFLYFEEAQVSRLELDQLGLLGLDFDLENRARI